MNRSKQAGMSKKTIVVLLIGLALALVHPAEAQQPKKMPRIERDYSSTLPRGLLGNSNEPATAKTLKEIELGARSFGVLQPLDVLGPKDIETGFRDATKTHAGALLVLDSAITADRRIQVANLAIKSLLPAIYRLSLWVDVGGLMSYGTSLTDLSLRAATYVDKILKGAKPADLPVEQPMKFELVINLKAAKQIGLMIPPNVLVRADKVIRCGGCRFWGEDPIEGGDIIAKQFWGDIFAKLLHGAVSLLSYLSLTGPPESR